MLLQMLSTAVEQRVTLEKPRVSSRTYCLRKSLATAVVEWIGFLSCAKWKLLEKSQSLPVGKPCSASSYQWRTHCLSGMSL